MASLAGWGLATNRMLAGAPGLVSRVRLPIKALGALGIAAIALFFADESRPIEQKDLIRFTVTEEGVLVGQRLVQLENREVSVEYVELDHAATGWHYVIPLAIVGRESELLHVDVVDRWIAEIVRSHVDSFQARGLLVHSRIDKRTVAPGETYEVADVAGQVTIRRVTR